MYVRRCYKGDSHDNFRAVCEVLFVLATVRRCRLTLSNPC